MLTFLSTQKVQNKTFFTQYNKMVIINGGDSVKKTIESYYTHFLKEN